MLEIMRVFVDTIELQSFSRSAARNHLTQSAVSQRVQQLEEELGHQLILRGRGRLQTTEAGRLFLNACKRILLDFDRVVEEMNGLRNIISGQVRLGTITSVGLHELPRHLTVFLREYPAVGLQLEYRNSKAIYEGLIDFSLDLGIVAYPMKHHQIASRPLRHDELVLIVPPGHPLARRRTVEIKRLHGQPFIAFASDVPTRKAIDRNLRQAKVEVRIVHQFDNVETIKRAVEIGAGAAIVPRATVQQEVSSKSLVALGLAGHDWKRPLAILSKKGNPPSPAVQKFIEVLERDAGQTTG